MTAKKINKTKKRRILNFEQHNWLRNALIQPMYASVSFEVEFFFQPQDRRDRML